MNHEGCLKNAGWKSMSPVLGGNINVHNFVRLYPLFVFSGDGRQQLLPCGAPCYPIVAAGQGQNIFRWQVVAQVVLMRRKAVGFAPCDPELGAGGIGVGVLNNPVPKEAQVFGPGGIGDGIGGAGGHTGAGKEALAIADKRAEKNHSVPAARAICFEEDGAKCAQRNADHPDFAIVGEVGHDGGVQFISQGAAAVVAKVGIHQPDIRCHAGRFQVGQQAMFDKRIHPVTAAGQENQRDFGRCGANGQCSHRNRIFDRADGTATGHEEHGEKSR